MLFIRSLHFAHWLRYLLCSHNNRSKAPIFILYICATSSDIAAIVLLQLPHPPGTFWEWANTAWCSVEVVHSVKETYSSSSDPQSRGEGEREGISLIIVSSTGIIIP